MYVSGLLSRSSFWLSPCAFWLVGQAVLEAEAVVSGFEDVAVMSQTVEQRGRHLASPKTLAHAPKLRLVMMMTFVCSYGSLRQMEARLRHCHE